PPQHGRTPQADVGGPVAAGDDHLAGDRPAHLMRPVAAASRPQDGAVQPAAGRRGSDQRDRPGRGHPRGAHPGRGPGDPVPGPRPMSGTFQKALRKSEGELIALLPEVEDFMKRHGASARAVSHVLVIFEEMILNLVKYASASATQDIDLRVEVT